MDATTLPRLLTPADVGLWLSLPVRQVIRLARLGQLPCRLLPNGEILFETAALAEWLAALPQRGGERDAL
jgi:hypothetical protein